MNSQQVMNMISSESTNNGVMDRSLKGLLMDKGRSGLEAKIHTLLRKIASVQGAMESLVEQQRLSREQVGCDCLDLYLAFNLKSGLSEEELSEIKTHGARVVQVAQTRQPLTVEWRARKGFSDAYGHIQTRRIYPFHARRVHCAQVREYVTQQAIGYYEILAGYDAIRISLNAALKSMRRDVVDLTVLIQEVEYPENIARDAEKAARRFFKRLPDSEIIAQSLIQKYS